MSPKKILLVLIPIFLLSCNLLNLAKSETKEPTSTPEAAEPTQAEDTPTAPAEETATPEPTAMDAVTDAPTAEPTAAFTATAQLPTTGNFRAVGVVSAILPGEVIDLAYVPDSGMWLLTQEGAAHYTGQSWEAQLFEISDGRIVLGIDDLGRVWAVSSDFSQMTYWQDGTWSNPTSGWRIVTNPYFPYAQKLITDSAGRVWYATTDDVRYFDGSTWTMFAPPQMYMPFFTSEDMIHQFTLSLFPYSEEVWVGQCDWSGPGPFSGQGARWYDGNAWNGATSPVVLGCVNSIAPDFVGNTVWVGLESTLLNYNRETSQWKAAINPPDPSSGLRLGDVLHITVAPDNNPWATFLACGGASCSTVALYAMQSEQWFELTAEGKELYDAQVLFDSALNTYVFTSGAGICQVNDDKLVTIAEIEAHHPMRDGTFNVWFTGEFEGQPEMIWTTAAQ